MNQHIPHEQEQINRQARDTALAQALNVEPAPTSLVSYHSDGYLLIIGEVQHGLAVARELTAANLSCCVLATHGEGEQPADIPLVFAERQTISVSGHLGAFNIVVDSEQGEIDIAQALNIGPGHFDLILDLHEQPLLDLEVMPFGYYASRDDEVELEQILDELPEMTGEFEKARFFSYDAEICAHGNSGLTGCTRCLDACPTGAISSLLDKVEIDPYYCQGGGSCATACPSGAIIYSYPRPADMINRLRTLLRHYRAAGGVDPVLLFHDGEAGAQSLSGVIEALPASTIAIEVEEIGSIGMDLWLSALAFGAGRVLLIDTPQVAASVRNEIEAQLDFARHILAGMGYPETVLARMMANDPAITADPGATMMPAIEPAGFAGSNEKRNTLFFAIDHLYKQAPDPRTMAELPAQAAFGEIRVDRDTCTLCMACVSVCPASALTDGGDTPQLNFVEANCVQCGLCERACPENAISRVARFVYDREQRMQTRVLNEEPPFYCIECGAAFATQSVIKKMTGKLQGHWMFQDETALKRLQMCGDCRVRTMFEEKNNSLLQ